MSLIALQGGIYAQHVHPFTHFHKLHTLSHPHNETMKDEDKMTLIVSVFYCHQQQLTVPEGYNHLLLLLAEC